MRLFGYAKVSTSQQSLDAQVKTLRTHKVWKKTLITMVSDLIPLREIIGIRISFQSFKTSVNNDPELRARCVNKVARAWWGAR